ncbi:MAG: hypothetical protein R3C17_17155 [Planctomycetaceae bacterium]
MDRKDIADRWNNSTTWFDPTPNYFDKPSQQLSTGTETNIKVLACPDDQSASGVVAGGLSYVANNGYYFRVTPQSRKRSDESLGEFANLEHGCRRHLGLIKANTTWPFRTATNQRLMLSATRVSFGATTELRRWLTRTGYVGRSNETARQLMAFMMVAGRQ